MKPYLDLLRFVRENGTLTPTRGVLRSTGSHVDAISVFAPPPFRCNLGDGFPLVTTKKVDFAAIAHELLWFLSGSTNVAYLQENCVHIWDKWADKQGELGPVYGKQWRSVERHHRWTDIDGREVSSTTRIDQIAELLIHIKAVHKDARHPSRRRLILSAWNVSELDDMVLPPCHMTAQFHVGDGRLSCHLYQRSADLFLGVPYNIASYALLTHMLAHVTGLGVGTLAISFGDAHIYCNHLEQVDEQLTREPLPHPSLSLAPHVRGIDDFTFADITLNDYAYHPALRGEVAV